MDTNTERAVAAEIKAATAAHIEAKAAHQTMVEKAIAAGEALIRLRDVLGEDWSKAWIAKHLPFSAATAYRYIQIAKVRPDPERSLNAVLREIAGTQSDSQIVELEHFFKLVDGKTGEPVKQKGYAVTMDRVEPSRFWSGRIPPEYQRACEVRAEQYHRTGMLDWTGNSLLCVPRGRGKFEVVQGIKNWVGCRWLADHIDPELRARITVPDSRPMGWQFGHVAHDLFLNHWGRTDLWALRYRLLNAVSGWQLANGQSEDPRETVSWLSAAEIAEWQRVQDVLPTHAEAFDDH